AGNEVILKYPDSGLNCITLHREDLARLNEGEFLNDTLIEFYIRWSTNSYSADKASDFHIFNTFFYQQLNSVDDVTKKRLTPENAYKRVKTWTKRVNIFEKRFVVVPINERLHWYLAVIWNPGAYLKKADLAILNIEDDDGDETKECRLFIFDSLDGKHPAVARVLSSYLRMEAMEKYGKEVADEPAKIVYAKVQSQLNYCDCGIFLCHYVTLMLRCPDLISRAILKNMELTESYFTSCTCIWFIARDSIDADIHAKKNFGFGKTEFDKIRQTTTTAITTAATTTITTTTLMHKFSLFKLLIT
ncbi:hypothetical protein HK100_011036, partial [Physocladia obscura]